MAGIDEGIAHADLVDSASLTLDLGQSDSAKVNAWKRMPECDEFVGARWVILINSTHNVPLYSTGNSLSDIVFVYVVCISLEYLV